MSIQNQVGTNYRAEVDGLRAIAVLPVVLFHAGIAMFAGGYVGVDIFFVISGYLITSVIINEKKAGLFSIVSFYERRARRILPALFFILLITLPFAWLWMLPKQMIDFANSLRAVMVFGSNIWFYYTSGYFDTAAEEKPLLHTWSLAVEEQFYLFFPFIILLLWRFGTKWLVSALTILTGMSFYYCLCYLEAGDTYGNFYLPHIRAWELLTGSLAAFALEYKDFFQKKLTFIFRNTLSVIGIVSIAFSIFTYSEATPFPSLYTLVPVCGALFVILFADEKTWVAKLLSTSALVKIGLVSYSFYLWHQPIFAFTRLYSSTLPTTTTFIFLSILSLALAFFSWKFIEQPFRNRNIFGRTQIFVMATVGTLFFSGLGYLGDKTDGFREQYAARLKSSGQKMLKKIETATSTAGMNAMYENGDCKFWSTDITSEFRKKFQNCEKTHQKALFILGDSHAMDLYNVIAKLSKHQFVVGLVKPGCRPANRPTECDVMLNRNFIIENKNSISTVFYTQSGQHMLTYGKMLPINHVYCKVTHDYLSELNQFVPLVWLGPQPELLLNISSINVLTNKTYVPVREDIFQVDEFLELMNKEYNEVKYLSKIRILNFTAEDIYYDGEFTYADHDHWSTYGEKVFGERLLTDKFFTSAILND